MNKENNLRRAVICRVLYRQGWSQQKIADALGTYPSVVYGYNKRTKLYNVDLEQYEQANANEILSNFWRERKSEKIYNLD